MTYKRTKVTTKEIIKLIKIRSSRLKQGIYEETDPVAKLNQIARKSELDKLLGVIMNDEILDVIKKMKKHKYTVLAGDEPK